MKWSNGTKTYNTETALLCKMVVDTEDLGNGYTRYSTRCVYVNQMTGKYFLYTNHTAIDKHLNIFDKQEWIVPVTDEWVKSFTRETPELYPYK